MSCRLFALAVFHIARQNLFCQQKREVRPTRTQWIIKCIELPSNWFTLVLTSSRRHATRNQSRMCRSWRCQSERPRSTKHYTKKRFGDGKIPKLLFMSAVGRTTRGLMLAIALDSTQGTALCSDHNHKLLPTFN
jgi:hypothetical protein